MFAIEKIKMRQLTVFCALMVCFSMVADGSESVAEVVRATSGGSAVVQIAGDVAEVGSNAAEILRLPLGIGEVLLSPLPGIGFLDGLEDLGKGLLAPLKTGISLLKLPYNILRRVGSREGDGTEFGCTLAALRNPDNQAT